LADEPQTETIPAAFSAARVEKVFPVDLAAAAIWLAAAVLALYLPLLNETPVGAFLVLPGILVLPGYCFIAALFPKDDDIDLAERIALSVGLSIAIVPLIALFLNFTPFGIRLDPVLAAVTIFSLAMILVAWYRRSLLPFEKRFVFPLGAMGQSLQNAIFPPGAGRFDRPIQAVITIVFILVILITVSMIITPREGERFTEFFILGENRTADYPDRISAGQSYPLFVGVGNHEHQNADYTIETWLLRREFDNATNTSRLIAMDPGDRLAVTLAHNETFVIPYNLSVRKTTYNRVEFLLFKDRAPGADITGDDRITMSYRNVNMWIRQEEIT
jgi:uncharacterized membrane protein